MTGRSLYVFAFAVCLVMETVAVVGQTPSRTPLATPQIAEKVTPAVVSIVVATFVYTWTTAYFSPYEKCMRDEGVQDNPYVTNQLQLRFVCAERSP